MNIMLYWRRLETNDWDLTSLWNQLTELINQARSRAIFALTRFKALLHWLHLSFCWVILIDIQAYYDTMWLRCTTNCIWMSVLHMCFVSDPVKQIKQRQTAFGSSGCKPPTVGVNKKLKTLHWLKLLFKSHCGLTPHQLPPFSLHFY